MLEYLIQQLSNPRSMAMLFAAVAALVFDLAQRWSGRRTAILSTRS